MRSTCLPPLKVQGTQEINCFDLRAIATPKSCRTTAKSRRLRGGESNNLRNMKKKSYKYYRRTEQIIGPNHYPMTNSVKHGLSAEVQLTALLLNHPRVVTTVRLHKDWQLPRQLEFLSIARRRLVQIWAMLGIFRGEKETFSDIYLTQTFPKKVFRESLIVMKTDVRRHMNMP